jgi:hypothetical protein
MHQKQLELLKLLRDATRSGRATWQRDGTASHYTDLADLRCSLRFKHPLLAGDDGSDADVVEVTAGQTVWTFYGGTEGFDLVGEILTAAYPEIRQHNQKIAARLEETIEKIRKVAG